MCFKDVWVNDESITENCGICEIELIIPKESPGLVAYENVLYGIRFPRRETAPVQ